ncbi:alpha/beta hydrolase [Paenibacillus sp. LHD-117]|uniref:alpha/beta hydrolase n=1 Tax=Paenibacillus sp. LHD-117 TaxID=3071412 RepID=UPI0027E16F1C|nr:alpha/beta hydrolase [Paenibacillus sp. LHD-117]MDQ6422850.1 alpha/beta hydrolase [Paenibacillus sp. LHD-117]
MTVTEGTFYGVNGVELFYRKVLASREAARGTVIAVHGHGDHSGGLQNLIERLAESGYHVYAHDLRGHGKSPGIRGFIRKWEEYRGDLHAFRELVVSETAGLPVYVIGHSMGGLISADYSLFHGHGISGLALIAPAISYEMTVYEKCLISLMGKLKPDLTVHKAGSPDLLTQDPEIRSRLASDPLRHDTVTPGLGLGMMQAVSRVMKQVKSMQLPLLLQYGLGDEITPPAKLREFYHSVGTGDKQNYEYDAMRHRLFDDFGRERFFADMLNWMDRHSAAN